MTDTHDAAAFLESLTAAYACRSWFCRDRGPHITPSLQAAEQLAAGHAARKWLGVWPHRTVAYRLSDEQRQAAADLAKLLRPQ